MKNKFRKKLARFYTIVNMFLFSVPQSVSQQTIMLKWIEKWDGKLPTYMLGDKTMMMVPDQK